MNNENPTKQNKTKQKINQRIHFSFWARAERQREALIHCPLLLSIQRVHKSTLYIYQFNLNHLRCMPTNVHRDAGDNQFEVNAAFVNVYGILQSNKLMEQ